MQYGLYVIAALLALSALLMVIAIPAKALRERQVS